MNLLSVLLAFAAAKCRYSSNTDDRHHFCSFLRHPTTQPVRCWKKTLVASTSGKSNAIVVRGSKMLNWTNSNARGLPCLSCSGWAPAGFLRLNRLKQEKS
jgi:hypothetical protein